MELFRAIKAAFRRMPQGVCYVTWGAMMLALFLPLAFLPGGETFVNGNRVSYAEFWRSGGGFLLAGIGVIGLILAYGLIRARRWARHLTVILCWFLVGSTIPDWRSFSPDVVGGFFIFGCLPTWYFYFRRSVREYFDPGVREEAG
ncbi:MAG TPA: hypothetical protein VL527_15155 [Dongiaceae bacterium]|jgi:hypothetical protein|nr:hypothetical protein [Dongiaceae bacterium]